MDIEGRPRTVIAIPIKPVNVSEIILFIRWLLCWKTTHHFPLGGTTTGAAVEFVALDMTLLASSVGSCSRLADHEAQSLLSSALMFNMTMKICGGRICRRRGMHLELEQIHSRRTLGSRESDLMPLNIHVTLPSVRLNLIATKDEIPSMQIRQLF